MGPGLEQAPEERSRGFCCSLYYLACTRILSLEVVPSAAIPIPSRKKLAQYITRKDEKSGSKPLLNADTQRPSPEKLYALDGWRIYNYQYYRRIILDGLDDCSGYKRRRYCNERLLGPSDRGDNRCIWESGFANIAMPKLVS